MDTLLAFTVFAVRPGEGDLDVDVGARYVELVTLDEVFRSVDETELMWVEVDFTELTWVEVDFMELMWVEVESTESSAAEAACSTTSTDEDVDRC